MRYFKSISFLIVIISILYYTSLKSQTETNGELLFYICNAENPLSVTVNSVSTNWGNPDYFYPITNSYNSYSKTVSYSWFFDHVFDINSSPNYVLGYAQYKITVAGANYIFIDYRDCDYNGEGNGYGSVDLFVYYNEDSSKFYKDSNLTKEFVSSITIWDELKTGDSPVPNTDDFENLVPPRNFDLTTISNQPVLEWASSGNPISDLAADHLEVYRSYNYGAFVKIANVAISSSDTTYTDDEIITTSPLYFIQYKMKTVNNQNVSSSYTAVEKVKGHYGTFDKSKMPFENIDSVPENYYLFKNYPNPFNSNTVIRYQLAKEGQVQLCIYNLAGAQVCELVNQAQPAGEYQLRWDGKNAIAQEVAGGIYLARLQIQNAGTVFQAVNKIIFMK